MLLCFIFCDFYHVLPFIATRESDYAVSESSRKFCGMMTTSSNEERYLFPGRRVELRVTDLVKETMVIHKVSTPEACNNFKCVFEPSNALARAREEYSKRNAAHRFSGSES